MVFRSREAPITFGCDITFNELQVCAGVRGLSWDEFSGVGSMKDWLMSLRQTRLVRK